MRRFIRARFEAWLARRLPVTSAITLSHRSLFIFPSREGWGFALVLGLTFIGAVNYQNSLGHVLAFLLLALGHLSIHHTFRNLSGLRLRLGHCPPVFAGEPASFPVLLESASGRAYPALELGFTEPPCVFIDVAPGALAVARLQAPTERRGWLTPSRVYVATHYPLGIMRCWSWLAFEGRCLVYPKPLAPPELPGAGLGDEAQSGRRESAGSEDYAGLRRYHAGDSLRQIDWKALARERGLFSKQFVESTGGLARLDYEAFAGVAEELRLSYLCFLVLRAEQEGTRYALYLPGESIAADLGAAHQERCLTALALFGLPR